jgi:hypothetical protein
MIMGSKWKWNNSNLLNTKSFYQSTIILYTEGTLPITPVVVQWGLADMKRWEEREFLQGKPHFILCHFGYMRFLYCHIKEVLKKLFKLIFINQLYPCKIKTTFICKIIQWNYFKLKYNVYHNMPVISMKTFCLVTEDWWHIIEELETL